MTRFHDHLDVCERCERNPFDLCPTGARLLSEAAAELGAPILNGVIMTDPTEEQLKRLTDLGYSTVNIDTYEQARRAIERAERAKP